MKKEIILFKKYESLRKIRFDFENLQGRLLTLLNNLEEDKDNIGNICKEFNIDFYSCGDKFFDFVNNDVKNFDIEIKDFGKKFSDIYSDLETQFSYIKEDIKKMYDTIRKIEDKTEEIEIEYTNLIE